MVEGPLCIPRSRCPSVYRPFLNPSPKPYRRSRLCTRPAGDPPLRARTRWLETSSGQSNTATPAHPPWNVENKKRSQKDTETSPRGSSEAPTPRGPLGLRFGRRNQTCGASCSPPPRGNTPASAHTAPPSQHSSRASRLRPVPKQAPFLPPPTETHEKKEVKDLKMMEDFVKSEVNKFPLRNRY